MISSEVYRSDSFTDMGFEAQALYAQLCFEADGIGAVDGVRGIMRMLGVGEPAFDELVDRGFVLIVDDPCGPVPFIADWFVNNNLNNRDMNAGKHAWLAIGELAFMNKNNRRYVVVGESGMGNGHVGLCEEIAALRNVAGVADDEGVKPAAPTMEARREPDVIPTGTQGEPLAKGNEMNGREGKEKRTKHAHAREKAMTAPCPQCGEECAASRDPLGDVRAYCYACGVDFCADRETGELICSEGV